MVRYKILKDVRYRVGDDGSVWSRCGWRSRIGKKWRILKKSTWSNPSYPGRYPYKVVGIGGKVIKVSTIVMTAFRGERPAGMECLHKNGIHDDDRLENLEWGTHERNCRDRIRHGTQNRGSGVSGSRLTELQIPDIRSRLSKVDSHESISKIFNVSRETITYISLGKTWTHC